MQSGLKECVRESRSHISQVKRSRPRAAQPGRALHDFPHHRQVAVEVVARAKWKAGRDQAFLHPDAFGNAQTAVVHVRAAPLGGGKEVIAAGIKYDGLLDLAFDRERNAHAVDRKAVDEVGRAVQRIDDPDKLGVFRAMGAARLLGMDAVPRVGGQQGLDDDLFAGVIDFGDKVVDLFLGDTHGLDVECCAVDDGASGACGLDGHVDHRV